MKKHRDHVGRLIQMVGVIALLFIVSGWTFPKAAATDNMAFVRIIHASPDVGIVDVFVDGRKLLSSFQFATVTEYVPLPAGSHNVQVALLGKGPNATMLAQTITMPANSTSTIAVLGTNASGLSFTVFTDNDGVSGDMAKLRVYHLSPGTGSVSITDGSQSIIQGLAYPQASDYVPLQTGPYHFDLKATPQPTNATFSAMLKPWTVTSVFVIGQLSGPQKFQFVTAQVPGVPHLPNTGSNPNLLPDATPALLSSTWLGILLLVGIGAMGLGAGWYGFIFLRKKQGL